MSINRFRHDSRPAVSNLVQAFGVVAERRGDDIPGAHRWLIRGNSAYKDSSQVDDYINQQNVRFAAGFQEVGRWRDGWYRVVWASGRLHCVVTYCEGDMTIELADNEITYQAIINYADRFYLR